MSTNPESPSEGESEVPGLVITIDQIALDQALHNNGVIPTQHLRETLANVLVASVSDWISETAAIVCDRIIINN